MITSRADELLLREDEGTILKVDNVEKPVTKALTGAQVVALLKEVATPVAAQQIDAKSPSKFRYECTEGVFSVRAMLQDDKWNVSIVVDDKGDFARRTGMIHTSSVQLPPEDAAPAPRASRKSVKISAQKPEKAKEAMETLLRTLVSEGASDQIGRAHV